MYKIAAIIGGVLLMAGVALAGTVSSLGAALRRRAHRPGRGRLDPGRLAPSRPETGSIAAPAEGLHPPGSSLEPLPCPWAVSPPRS